VLEQLLGVAAHSDRAVDDPASAAGTQEEGHFVTEDWNVGVFGLAHSRYVFGLMHTGCVFGLAPAYTGSFSIECARLAFGCASPCHCPAIVPCFAVMPFACGAVVPWTCGAVVPFAAHG
jgi:hypothetical protein